MIAIVCDDDSRAAADSIMADLSEAYRGQLNVVTEAASSPNPWPDDVNWDDLLIVLYARPELPEPARNFISEFLRERGKHSLVENARAMSVVVVLFDSSGGAQDIGDADALTLARELIAAARPADAVKDAFMHQGLQHRLEMA